MDKELPGIREYKLSILLQNLKNLLNSQALIIFLILIVFFIQARRLFLLVYNFSVNIIFWDQFDILTPLFTHQSFWTQFRWQNGPHRQGAGFILIKWIADWTKWNARADAFFILGLVITSLILVLALKRLLFGKFSIADVFLPLIVLNLYQFEIFIGTPNISLAGLPLVLVFCYAFSWFIKNIYLRYIAILLLNFLLIFTGFGIFMGLMTVFILTLDIFLFYKTQGRKQMILTAAAWIISLISFLLYYQGYVFIPAVNCFENTWSNITRLPVFWSLILSLFFGVRYGNNIFLASLVGLIAILAMIYALLKHILRYAHGPERGNITSKMIILLVGFSILYSGSASLGRVCLGYQSAQASRYMTLLIPGMVGLFFNLSSIRSWRAILAPFIIMAVLIGKSALPLPQIVQNDILWFYEGKYRWKTCYLEVENVEICNQRTGFKIYPTVNKKIIDDLNYLKREKLNLYLDDLPKEDR
jgi:hypothetical protein